MKPVSHALRLTLPLLAALALVAVVAGVIVTRSARAWYASELTLRARLAASGARQVLLDATARGNMPQVDRALRDLARADRIVAVALCDLEPAPTARSNGYPDDAFTCARLRTYLPPAAEPTGERAGVLNLSPDSLPMHITLVPIVGSAGAPTSLSLAVVQDFAYVQERVGLVQRWGLAVLATMAAGAALLTVLAARLTSVGWMRELQGALRGDREPAASASPLLNDVRVLAQRRSAATAEADEGGHWSSDRLHDTMQGHLDDDGLIIVANREPYIHERTPDGGIAVQHPASGLVTALEPVMRACSGVWIAHGSGSADRETADAHGRLRVPPGEESYALRRVWMTDEEESGYYYGLANEGLWPLCHVAYARPIFRATDWAHYTTINARFADAVAAEASVDDPIVLVQDYHFALAPRLIRERLPRATIITFWHIPFPNAERFGICPWREQIIDGLLGSSIVGFHTQAHCNQFLDAVDTFVESRIDRVDQAVILGGTRTLVRPYPISVEWPIRWLDDVAPAPHCRQDVFAELGLADDAVLAVGVDRLDYTKGLEERVEAVERLLERRPDLVGRFTFVQLAAPSRTRIPRYQQLNEAVEESVRRLQERFGSDTYRPVILLRDHHEPQRVFSFYRAAQICYVSSLHDGMNLVSKEFVAARDDERGVLVLSRFAGAAHELPEALIVNPYDLEEASSALERAVFMSEHEQAERMRALRAVVAEKNVYRWAGRMLLDASHLRQRARRTLQLSADDQRHGMGS